MEGNSEESALETFARMEIKKRLCIYEGVFRENRKPKKNMLKDREMFENDLTTVDLYSISIKYISYVFLNALQNTNSFKVNITSELHSLYFWTTAFVDS